MPLSEHKIRSLIEGVKVDPFEVAIHIDDISQRIGRVTQHIQNVGARRPEGSDLEKLLRESRERLERDLRLAYSLQAAKDTVLDIEGDSLGTKYSVADLWNRLRSSVPTMLEPSSILMAVRDAVTKVIFQHIISNVNDEERNFDHVAVESIINEYLPLPEQDVR